MLVRTFSPGFRPGLACAATPWLRGSGTKGSPVGAQHESPGRKPWESGATTCHQPHRGGTPNGAGDRIEAQNVSPLRGLGIPARTFSPGFRPGLACTATPWLRSSGTNGSPVGAQHESPGRKPWKSSAITCHQPLTRRGPLRGPSRPASAAKPLRRVKGGTPNGAGNRIETQHVSPLRGLLIRGRSCPQGFRPGLTCSATPWLAIALITSGSCALAKPFAQIVAA